MQQATAQVLVPYRIGNKFGLSDDKGKIVVAPAYDEIEYLEGKYFQCTNLNTSKDTIRYYSGEVRVEEREHPTFTLFYKSKLVIAKAPFKHFLIYDYCLVSSDNPYHPEDCVLYNLKGEQLLKEPVRALGINDSRDFGPIVRASTKLTLISVFERDRRQRLYSIAIFNNEKQQITSWLLRRVTDLKADEFDRSNTRVLLAYSDETGFHEKYLRFSNGRFELVDKSKLPQQNTTTDRGDDLGNVPVEVEPGMNALPEPPMESKAAQAAERDFATYTLSHDSLFNATLHSKAYVALPADAKPIFIYSPTSIQVVPVIFKQQQKFGLVMKGVPGEAKYDSLAYLGDNYLAAITVNGALKLGKMARLA